MSSTVVISPTPARESSRQDGVLGTDGAAARLTDKSMNGTDDDTR